VPPSERVTVSDHTHRWGFILMGLLVLLFGSGAAIRGFGIQNRSVAPMNNEGTSSGSTSPREIVALGYIEPLSRVIKIGAPSSSEPTARMQELKVAEGATVQVGDLLAVLDSASRLQAAVLEAQANLELRRSQFNRSEVESRAVVQQQRETVTRLEASSAAAQRELQRQENLYSSGLIPFQTLDEKRLAAQIAQRQYLEAKVSLEKAQTLTSGNLFLDTRVAKDEVDLAQASLEKARVDLQASQVRAPSGGLVLRVMVHPGEPIPSGGAILELADTAQMGIRIELDESDLDRIQIGQHVEAVNSGKALAFVGRVIRVAREVKKQTIFDSDAAARVDARSIEVWAELDSASTSRAAKQIYAQVRVYFSGTELQ
jgi:HlyD family secretion protein